MKKRAGPTTPARNRSIRWRPSKYVFTTGVAALLVSAPLAHADSTTSAAAFAAAAAAAGPKTPSPAPRTARPSGPNPYLAFLPAEAKPDTAAWQAWMRSEGKVKRAAMPAVDPRKLVLTSESEPNGSQATADPVPGFGTGPSEDPAADVSGTAAAPPPPTLIGPFAEDDGAIPLAHPTGLVSGQTVRTSATIGDGPFGLSGGGTGSGDFDFYSISGLSAGDEIMIDVDTPQPFCCDLDPFVVVWDSAGVVLAFNDDQPTGGSYDSFLRINVPSAGTYYVSIGAYQAAAPSNPFDSSSGLGAASEGTYDVAIGVNVGDSDYFAIDLDAGDVISANLVGAFGGRLSLRDPSGVERVGSAQDATAIEPGPFPGGGTAAFAYVVEAAGSYAVKVDAVPGAYTLELRGFRPALESGAPNAVQTLFVDFDGATVDPAIFGGPAGPVALSPLATFLPGWGLAPGDQNAVIDGILDVIAENLSDDMRVFAANGDYDVSGIPGDFDLVILNSRDHADPFGNPNVSRLILGGTIPELGIGTIGIAESIDPGNFATNETAVVLLDLLSEPPFDPNSLNQFPLAGGATQIDLVAAGVGNVASHEAGHFFANFHTHQFNATPNLMDQGGNLPGIVGVGVDLTLGTGDDVDVDFGVDTFVPNEGFTGREDTLNAVAFGLSTSLDDGTACPPTPRGGCRTAAKGSLLIKDSSVNTARDGVTFHWLKGDATTFGDLVNPLTVGSYRLCVYDAGGLVRSAAAPTGGTCKNKPCWKATGPVSNRNGYAYRDPLRTPDGTQSVVLRSGITTKANAHWTAKGDLLGDTPLSVTPPVVAQIHSATSPLCFAQTFSAAQVKKNTTEQFKAVVP